MIFPETFNATTITTKVQLISKIDIRNPSFNKINNKIINENETAKKNYKKIYCTKKRKKTIKIDEHNIKQYFYMETLHDNRYSYIILWY